MKSSIGSWIEAMRLRTLPVSLAGVVTAAAYAVADGCFSTLPWVLCLLFALLCQIASNFANEYYDFKAGRDRAGREGPRRGVTEGDITPKAMKTACFATLALAAAVGLSLTLWGGLWLIVAGLLIGMGALAYSAGPYPLSTHCLGEVAVVIFFGIVPVNLTYYVMSGVWSGEVLAGSLAVGLMGANVLIVNNYRDIPDDIAAGKHTLATTFGRTAMLWLYVANAVAASLLTLAPWGDCGGAWIAAPSLYTFYSVSIALSMRRRHGASLNPYLGLTAMLMFLYSIILLVAICLSR